MKDDKYKINLIDNLSSTLNSILTLKQSKSNAAIDEDIMTCFKILILDDVSTKILSPILKQSSLNRNNVTLTVKLSDNKQPIDDVMAIYIITPTKENLSFLLRDINNKTYQNYSINLIDNVDDSSFQSFIYNIVQKDSSNIYNINVYPMNFAFYHSNVFDMDYKEPYSLLNSDNTKEEDSMMYIDEVANGLFSLMFSTKTTPEIVCRNGWFANDIIKKIQYKFNSAFSKFPELKNEFMENDNRSLMVIFNRADDIPIMFHHASSLGAMLNDICGISLSEDKKKDKDTFVVDPINDYIWNKSITTPFYTVGEEAFLEYKKYIEEMRQFNVSKESEGNVEQLAKESEKLATSIENLNEKKVKGDILSKQATFYKTINENTNKRNLGQLYEVEDILLRKRASNKEISNKLQEIFSKEIKAENVNDIFRLCLINMLICKDVKESDIQNQLGKYYNKSQMEGVIHYLYQTVDRSSNQEEESNSLAKKYLKKGLNYFVKKVSSLMVTEQPSMIADIVNSLSKEKEVKGFSTYKINEKFYSVKNSGSYKNVFVFIVGGGSLAEYEYISELLSRNRLNVIYGCDKLYRPDDFIDEIRKLTENKQN